MADPTEDLKRRNLHQSEHPAERAQVQQDWLIASARHGRLAREALEKAAAVTAGEIPGRRPDTELAHAWAAVGQGWAALSQADAARASALAELAVDQAGLNVDP